MLALRLALIKCHARADVDDGALRLERNGRVAHLRFDPGWAASHPRTLHLLREEAQAWARQGSLVLSLPD